MEEAKKETKIYIDREEYTVPNPVSGKELYRIGEVDHDHELFREACSAGEEDLIPKDETHIHLKPEERFYSQKDFHIVVNGQKKEVATSRISFARVVELAYPNLPTGPNVIFTVTYRHGPHHHSHGSLTKGEMVRLKNHQVFNVTATDKS